MLAGRPHEAAGNGSPRWMTAAPRERGTEPGLQAGSPPIIWLTWDGMVTAFPGSVPVPSEPGSGQRKGTAKSQYGTLSLARGDVRDR
jgi:hypothetical protein